MIVNLYHPNLKISVFLLLSLFLVISFSGCIENKNGKIFSPEVTIKRYDIECNLDSLAFIYKNFREDIYIPIKISHKGETKKAAMRVRGDTSRELPKKSLKVKFEDSGFTGPSKKLNLNAEYLDKSYVRAFVSSKIMQHAGQTCFNSNFAEVYLNGKFYGLYLEVENIDKHFLRRNNMEVDNCKLYKAKRDGACLTLKDNFFSDWESKRKKKRGLYDLKLLIDSLNLLDQPSFDRYVKKYFDYPKLVNIIALNMLTANGSTYYHNYYMYHNYNSNKWEMLPWDLDKTLSYYNYLPYDPLRTSSFSESDNILIERCLLSDAIRADVLKRIEEIREDFFSREAMAGVFKELEEKLAPMVEKDDRDQLEAVTPWKKVLQNEARGIDLLYHRLKEQFARRPQSFKVHPQEPKYTGRSIFRWDRAPHPEEKPVSYAFKIGRDKDLDRKAEFIIKDITSDSLLFDEKLESGTYYWKVSAVSGDYTVDGFNSYNVLEVATATMLPEKIQTTTRLTKDASPYSIPKVLNIAKGVELSIEPGVEIQLGEGAGIYSEGKIIARGSRKEPIRFIPSGDAQSWNEIYFYPPFAEGIFEYCQFQEGCIRSKKTSMSLSHCSIDIDNRVMESSEKRDLIYYCDGGDIRFSDCQVRGNTKGEGLLFFNAEVLVERCEIEYVPDAIELIGCNHSTVSNNFVAFSPDDAIDLNNCSSTLIQGNVLYRNTDKGISVGTEQYGPSKKDIVIKRNFLLENAMGIGVKDSSKSVVEHNTFWGNKIAIAAYKKREDFALGGQIEGFGNLFLHKKEEWIKVDSLSDYVSESDRFDYEAGASGTLVPDSLHWYEFYPGVVVPDHKKETLLTFAGAMDIGRYPVRIEEIKFDDTEEFYLGDWIVLTNPLATDQNIGNCTISIKSSSEKEMVIELPPDTWIEANAELFLTNKYLDVLWTYPQKPNVGCYTKKLPRDIKEVSLLNPEGKEIAKYPHNQ